MIAGPAIFTELATVSQTVCVCVCVCVCACVSNSKHWFTTSFLWRKVPESGARSVCVCVCV